MTTRRLAALIVGATALGLIAFGIVRGITPTGPAHGVRLILAIDPPVDDATRAMAADVARDRLGEAELQVRVEPADDRLVVEVGIDDPELVLTLATLLERTANLEIHAVDAANAWLARVTAFATTDPQAPAAHIRVEDGVLVADDRRDELPAAEADAIGCRGRVDQGKRTCRRHGDELIAWYLGALASRDPALVAPADRVVAYGRIDDDTWRAYVLEREVKLDGRAIRHAEILDGGVALDVDAPERLSRIVPKTPIAFVLDGQVRQVTAPDRVAGVNLHVPIRGANEDAAIASALDLVAGIKAGAVHALRVRHQETFSRPTGVLPRAWPFFAAALVLLVVAGVLWRARAANRTR